MDKECDFNLAEENNYSIISNDDLQDMTQSTDYSSFGLTSIARTLPNDTSNNSNIRYSNYSNSKLQPSTTSLLNNIHTQNGSSAGNAPTDEAFRQYIDQFTAYLVKHDPKSLHYLMDNINKRKNAELDFNDMGRTTPLLFSKMHALAKLDFPGLLYQLLPNGLSESGGMITITDDVYPKYYDFNFDDYPGPLSTETTTEEQIFYYLKDQTSLEYQDSLPPDWNSEKLLINYLELLIKEDGKPRMSNVVRLLNEGMETKTAEFDKGYKSYESVSRNSFSRTSSRATSRASSRAPSPENKEIIDNDLPQNSLDTPRGPGSVSSVVRRAVATASQDQKSFQHMDKYREYIWSGRFEEAVNFAQRAGLWDHAFALALRMNNAALVTEILTSFSRRAIHSHDPLFTMHELMAARPPRIVATNRGFSNTDMDEWRSHLSMILAVRKFRPEESRQAIESMGDKLVLLRCYYAAHLCYLLADTPFGIDKSAHKYRRKYDLIGWQSSTSNIPAQKSTYENCHKLFTGSKYWHSAPEQCIKLTEIYEYILKLRHDDSHKLLAIHLLPYKYLMAFRLLALQRTRSAYEYCQNIGEILGYRDINWLQCESINFTMVANVRNLSYKLHSRLLADEDYGDTNIVHNEWLENINDVYCQFCDRYKLWNPKKTTWTLLNIAETVMDGNDYGAESVFSDSCSQMRLLAGNIDADRVYSQQPAAPISQQYQNSMQGRVINDRNHPNTDNNTIRPTYGNVSLNHSQQQSQPIQSTIAQISPRMSTSVSSLVYQDHQQYHVSQEQSTKNVVNIGSSRYPFAGSNFSDIPPPSELPTEAIMTAPPKRFDIRNATSASVDWTRDRQPVTDLGLMKKSDYSHQHHHVAATQPIQELHNRSQLPVLPEKKSSFSGGYDSQSQYINYEVQSRENRQVHSSMFMPSATEEMRGSNETVDCFAVMPAGTRSRTQSNGSVGSADSQIRGASRHSLSRSRNSSESKDTKVPSIGHVTNRSLETTKEEIELQKQEQTKNEPPSTAQKKTGWNIFGYFTSKVKDAHLPDDSQKPWEYDASKNLWINKSDPQIERRPSPPPNIPVTDNIAQYGYSSPTIPFQGGQPQSSLSKYRQAAPNIRPSLNAPTPALPSYRAPAPITYQQPPQQYNNNDYVDQRTYLRDDNPQYSSTDGQFHYPNVNYQMDPSVPYDSNIYHTNYQTTMNQ